MHLLPYVMMKGVWIHVARRVAFRPFATIRSFSLSATRCNDRRIDLGAEALQKMAANPLVNRLTKSENAMKTLQQTTQLLEKKGYSGDIGALKQMKLLFDKDIREQIVKLREVMKSEGIEMRQEDLKGLYEIMGWQPPK